MRISHSTDEELVIKDFPLWVGLIVFPLAVFLATQLGVELTRRRIDGEQVASCVLGLGVLLICGIAITKRSVFRFDRRRRELHWHRSGVFGRNGGVVPFDLISGVLVESIFHSPPSYRVALRTLDGPVALTNSYSRGEAHRTKCEAMRDAIEVVLRIKTSADVESDIVYRTLLN